VGRETYRVTLPAAPVDGAASGAANGAAGAPDVDVDTLLGLAAEAGVLIESVEPVRSTLEEVFLGALGDNSKAIAGGAK